MTDPAPPGPAPSGRTPFDVLAERLKLPAGWSGRLTHIGLLAAVSVAASMFISPGLSAQQIPLLTEADIGRPFRANSASGFKANRDYEIVHSSRTEQLRQEARAAVKPVYDFNPAVSSDVRQAVHEAFAAMREVIARQRAAAQPPAPPGEDGEHEHGRANPPPLSAAAKKKLEAEHKAAEEALTALLGTKREAFEARMLPLEDADWEELVQARFSEEAEQAVLTLIDRAYPVERRFAVPVAASRDELQQIEGGFITIRDVVTRQERQSPVASPAVIDVREAKAELDRFASVPGNILGEGSIALRRAVLRLAKRQIRPNLTVNTAETENRRVAAAAAVKDAVIQIKKGQKIIGDGELINETHLVILNGMRAQTDQLDVVQVKLGIIGLVALVIAAFYAFHRAAFRRFRPTRKDALVLGLLLVAMLGLIHVWTTVAEAVHDRYGDIPIEAFQYAIPVAAGAMLVRFLLSQELALFFALVISCLAGVMLGNSLAFGIFSLVGSVVAAERIPRAKDRVGIFKAGFLTGAANLITVLFFAFAEGKGFTLDNLYVAMFTLVGTSIAVPVTVMALTPLIEATFGYASDIKLLELANLNHPALKELIVQAPGTYHHSIIMGSLVEQAAEAIGANPLLARSCAYYHDIGKGRNPLYFGENQKGENRHDQLAPAMSAVIIKRHVTEGMEMARQYRLPKLVADAIPQHHGTRVVGFFFHKAMKEIEGKENAPPIDESIYRYPGPKPQFREAALVMIADAVEAASRSMPDQSTPKLQALVQKMINMIFSEGQLDECDLTLRDLNVIAQSFVHTLEGIYHARPAYPAGAVGPRTSQSSQNDPRLPALTGMPGGRGEEKADSKRAGSA
ncbi:MAG: HDIG domain-containing protein [Myxococcaceae bacterium]|nr:HDIG domain-containing protein [Myxococcaceae bacterium]